MKLINRDFSLRSKVLLVILGIILVVLVYFQFVDGPVREEIEKARNEKESIQTELIVAQAKAAQLEKMKNEIDRIMANDAVKLMSSYNNSKEELETLNKVLSSTLQYSVSFANVTRNGNQIRRNFSLQFTTRDYNAMERVISALAQSDCRCLIGDVRCTDTHNRDGSTTLLVSATATFFETMVGGTPDAGLPEDSASK